MNRSAEFQDAMRLALRGEIEPAAGYLETPQSGDRIAVYRNNRAVALADTLSRAFPAVNTLVGTKFMRAVAIEFAKSHPPKNPVLALYGADFPDFLANFPPAAHLAYLADIARLDRAWTEAHFASDAGIESPVPGPHDALCLSPRARLLRLSWPVHDLWVSSRQGLAPPTDQLEPRRQTALVWRGPQGMDSDILTEVQATALSGLDAGAQDAPRTLAPLIERGAILSRSTLQETAQ